MEQLYLTHGLVYAGKNGSFNCKHIISRAEPVPQLQVSSVSSISLLFRTWVPLGWDLDVTDEWILVRPGSQGLCSLLAFASCGSFPATRLLLWVLSLCLAAISIKLGWASSSLGLLSSQMLPCHELLGLLKVCLWYRGMHWSLKLVPTSVCRCVFPCRGQNLSQIFICVCTCSFPKYKSVQRGQADHTSWWVSAAELLLILSW